MSTIQSHNLVEGSLKMYTNVFHKGAIFLKEIKKEFTKLYHTSPENKYKRGDYDFIRVLGQGTFGMVYLAVLRETGKKYAIKMIEKQKIVKTKQVKYILQEKRILRAVNFPFCVHLEASFQSTRRIYMCLPYLPGGDMFTLLKGKKKFDEEVSKFYSAQIILALEYLHYLNLVHRDLKAENVVLDSNGYVKLTDFGLSKKLSNKRTYTFCGTPEYLAPEIIFHRGYGKSVDWWSLGVLTFEMSAGYTPFKAPDAILIYEKTTTGSYNVPYHFSEELSDLIKNLLQVDLSKRYGNLKGGINDIKGHPWFSSMDWTALLNFSVPAPYIPMERGVSEGRDPTENITDDLRNTPEEYDIKELDDF